MSAAGAGTTFFARACMGGLPALELTCFGPPTARVGGAEPPPDVLWRRHLAMLAHLSLSPGRARTRDHLLGLLWPEREQKDARHSLSEAIRRLRRSLGDERLQTRGDTIVLNDAGLTVDVLRFEQELERNPARALDLVRGDFLEGLALDDARSFEDWLSSERDRWRARATAAWISLGERALAGLNFAEARDSARRALMLQPLHEPAVRLAVRAAALGGDPAGALTAFHDFTRRMDEELGEKPGRELTALAERVRRESWRPSTRGGAEEEPPLVGRERAHNRVFETVAAGVSDGPQVVLITGAHGMGRTRLLAECQSRLALEGAVVASARPLETDHDAPWSTLRMLFRAGLTDAPGLMGADPGAVAVLAHLIPEIPAGTAREPRDAAHVAAALAAALQAIAEEKPVCLAIDDAHLSDNATLEALAAALPQLEHLPVVCILTAVDPMVTPVRGLVHLRGEIGRSLRGVSVRLDSLSADEMNQLTRALASWSQGEEEQQRLSRRLMHETGGNPFYAVALLRGLRRVSMLRENFIAWPRPDDTQDSPMPFSLPDLTRTAIAARIAELSATAQRVLGAASVLGVALDLELLAAVTEFDRGVVEDSLAEAERRQLVRFDGMRYAFAAGIIAEVVRRECVTPGVRTGIQQRALAALVGRSDLESAVLRAELMARLEPGSAAFDQAVSVARATMATESPRTGRRAIAAAERAAGTDRSPEQVRIIEELKAQATGGTTDGH